MEPHVFVVMPFGVREAQAAIPTADGKPTQPAIEIDFTEVYEVLLKPPLTKSGCVPFRADEEQAAGDIRTDMYFELVTADVILADISILNANIFYELGIRHGVAQRGVLMIHGGWTRPPFDIAPDRRFEYDGKLFLYQERATRRDERSSDRDKLIRKDAEVFIPNYRKDFSRNRKGCPESRFLCYSYHPVKKPTARKYNPRWKSPSVSRL